jgi:hypothetical protein
MFLNVQGRRWTVHGRNAWNLLHSGDSNHHLRAGISNGSWLMACKLPQLHCSTG